MDARISVLICNWLNQPHKVGTVKVLEDATVITAIWDIEVQQQIFILGTYQLWSYVSNHTRWRQSLNGEKVLNTRETMDRKEKDSQNQRIGQNE